MSPPLEEQGTLPRDIRGTSFEPSKSLYMDNSPSCVTWSEPGIHTKCVVTVIPCSHFSPAVRGGWAWSLPSGVNPKYSSARNRVADVKWNALFLSPHSTPSLFQGPARHEGGEGILGRVNCPVVFSSVLIFLLSIIWTAGHSLANREQRFLLGLLCLFHLFQLSLLELLLRHFAANLPSFSPWEQWDQRRDIISFFKSWI